VFELICKDPNVGSVLFAMPADYGENTVAVSRDAVEIAQATGTLLIPVWMSPRRGDGYQVLHAAGMAPVDGVRRAVKALRRFAEWRGTELPATTGTPAPAIDSAQPRAASERALAYEQSKELLSSTGVRVPLESLVTSAAEAAEAAELIGGPVVMKLSATGPDP